MKVSDGVKLYIKIFGILLFIVYLIYSDSTAQFTCDKWANNFKNKEQFHLILTSKNTNNKIGYLKGLDIVSKQYTEYEDGGGWIAQNIDTFKIGDTLIKKLGKYSVIIKRKDKTISLPFKCEDKIYK